MRSGSARVTLALDVTLAAALVVTPLVFTGSLRTFATAKIIALGLWVGAAAVLAAFVPGRGGRVERGVMLAVGLLLASVAWRPDLEGVAAAGYLAAGGILLCLLLERVPTWTTRRLALVVGIPLGLGLAYSLAQCLGIGVLEATTTAFGTTHGHAVGTIGNPNENTWYLLLAAVLVAGLVKDRRLGLAFVAVGLVVVVDRARATALVGGLLGAGLGWARGTAQTPRPSRGTAQAWTLGALGLGAAVGAGLWWGGGQALQGRWFLARVGLRMLASARGLPQGPGAYARDFPDAQAQVLEDSPRLAGFESRLDHAHLDGLELLYDFGPLALVVGVLAVVAIVRALRRDLSSDRRAGALTLLTGAGLSLLGYPLYSPACMVVLAVALALALRDEELERRRSPVLHSGLLLAIGVGLLLLATHQLRGERMLVRALQAQADGQLVQGRALARSAAAYYPSADVLLILGNFELVTGERERAIAAYRRSLRLRPRATVRVNLERARRTDLR